MSLAEPLPMEAPAGAESVNPILDDLTKIALLLDDLRFRHPDSQYAKEWRETSDKILSFLLCPDRRSQAQCLLKCTHATASILRWNLIYHRDPPLNQEEEVNVHQLFFACSYDLYLMAVGLDLPI